MDPGDGRHQPCVICSIASTISAPFFGEREISDSVHIRTPLRPCIFHANGNMVSTFRYGNTDISRCARIAQGRRRSSDLWLELAREWADKTDRLFLQVTLKST